MAKSFNLKNIINSIDEEVVAQALALKLKHEEEDMEYLASSANAHHEFARAQREAEIERYHAFIVVENARNVDYEGSLWR